mgnify:CR=1 FL=1
MSIAVLLAQKNNVSILDICKERVETINNGNSTISDSKIEEFLNKQKKIDETEFDAITKFDYLDNIKNSSKKISSFLTIQEGCDKFCHFCVVPFTRGPEYSRPFKKILEEAENLSENGVREITLLGQNVNAYNYENYRLSDLILEIEKLDGIKRIRYTTSHPRDMTEDLINVYGVSKKLMPLVHLPVQSGSNKILKSMNRKHQISDYINTYEKLQKINPKIKFSSDFIIAYPGEDEKDFNETCDLINKIKFINSFSFIFSPRPGTTAANFELIDKKISLTRLEKVQKHLFTNQIKEDNTSEEIANLVSKTINVGKLNDLEAFNIIRQHNLDVMIDIMGYTSRNRIEFYKNRIAKKQVLWMGYCNTSGLKNMDFIITDPNLVLKNEEKYYIEKI